jgi:hypothetical protein
MNLYELRHKVSKYVWKRSIKLMGRVVNVRVGRFRLSGYVMASDKTFLYTPYVTADGKFYCNCRGFESSETICSHILGMMRKAVVQGYDIQIFVDGLLGKYKEDDFMKVYETSLKAYDDLFGGLQAGRHISAVVSEPEIGKSLLNGTFAYDMAVKHGLSSLIIDTEGGFSPEWIRLIGEHRGKEVPVEFIDFKVRIEKKKGKGKESYIPTFNYKKLKYKKHDEPTVYIHDARHIVKIMPFLGRPLSFAMKGGVIEPIEAGNMLPIWDSPVGRIVEDCNVGFVANDSLSMPIKSFFSGGQINYRTRATTTAAWLGRAQDLVDEFGVVFMNTAHASIDHTNPYSKPNVFGGNAVIHNNKYVALMYRYEGKAVAKAAGVDFRNLRRLSIYRCPFKTPWSEETYCMTSEQGVIDFDRDKYLGD